MNTNSATTPHPDMTPEQRALLASVTQTDDTMAPPPLDGEGNPIPPEAERIDPIAENRAILQMLLDMADPAAPYLKKIYTPDVVERIAAAYTAVEQKYGWDIKSHLGPELVLALVALPPTITAIAVGRAYAAQMRAKAEKERTVDEVKPTESAADGNG